MNYFTYTLPNGIRLIHQYVDSPVAHCGVIFNTGSRDEKSDEQGMAHFIEHTIFKGTHKRKAYHILSRLEDVGGELNAYTTKEETALYASFLNEYYNRTIELFSDILINSTFPEKELKKEKEVIIEEINSYNDSPSELIFDEFEDLVYDGHPIGRNILGTPENIKRFNRNDVKRFIRENYNTDEMVICSVGKITPKKFQNLVERHFAHVPENPRKHQREKFTGYKPETRLIHKDTFQAHCIVGNEAYDSKHPQRMAMILLNNILGGQSMNSRLNLSLRERNGMAYNVESSYTAYTDTGIINIYFGTDKENLERAIKLVNREIKKLQTQEMGSLQLSKAKKQLIGQLAMAQENREDLMLTLGKSFLLYNRVDSLEKVNAKIEKVTAGELMEIANEVLDREKLSTLIFK
ncbi:M16 family metallopeptidase [Prolixibacter denitrificans]|uniref:Peptidase M16 n=1 Tax=Prolixibacter denitrificans TaxID=1541063 RepID=A0A2P8CKJ7_9BACT|nr:pitrilysin family protein [Prolixibacter denitrificans]PSK85494.1 putative Zn-dependent peptidase [Prolixibacter denitrificans]GET20117.1 peptidase M16 [Prolixibacter denitrificans]